MKKFLSLILVLAMCLSMVAGAFAEEDWVKTPGEIAQWDREVDFLIVGYGLAGAAAAVEAHDIDPEADVLVLEKMPRSLAGGNSIASGQTFLVPAQEAVSTLKTYLTNCNEPNDIPEEYMSERVLMNMVICLPHQLSVELYSIEQLVEMSTAAN